MELTDAVMVLVALALPIWLLVEQVLWGTSSKQSQAELDSARSSVESPKKGTVDRHQRPAFPQLPRKVA
jgi:hypothetical protein